MNGGGEVVEISEVAVTSIIAVGWILVVWFWGI